MSAKLRAYRPESDFGLVRDFLVSTWAHFGPPVNWGLERWNYARYFVAPMLGSEGTAEGTPEGAIRAIQLWEQLVGVWEDSQGAIAGVACIEHPDPSHSGFGESFIERHPDHLGLLDEMLQYAEERFANRQNETWIYIWDDDKELIEVARRRGYSRDEARTTSHLEYEIGELPGLSLPDGYSIRSMAEGNDIEARREIFGRSFNHEDPRDWPSAFSYRELQKAPDYHKENDLVVVAPDGSFAACCVFWYDDYNRLGLLEPLGVHPEHRRLGLGRELLFDALRRLKPKGALRMPMTGGFDPFYVGVGFRELRTAHRWNRCLE